METLVLTERELSCEEYTQFEMIDKRAVSTETSTTPSLFDEILDYMQELVWNN